jgi:chemotaxis protein methyltransferase CheR
MSTVIPTVIYKFFADFVFDKTGIFYPEKDYYRLDSRINKLIAKFKYEDVNDLHQKYKNNMTAEMETFLVDICTNNETYFFRDEKPFKALVNDMIPAISKNKNSNKVDIWSCASSTGQEPLSIMMSIKEAQELGQIDKQIDVKFKATDISTTALAKAQSGLYSGLDVQRGLPIQLMVKYFESDNSGSWKAKSDIHSPITYSSFNLFSKTYPLEQFDIIFCRNVLIYQNPENKKHILNQLMNCLRNGGYLIMGAGESLIGTDIKLEQCSLSNALVFQKSL